jgi:hypothetical protein
VTTHTCSECGCPGASIWHQPFGGKRVDCLNRRCRHWYAEQWRHTQVDRDDLVAWVTTYQPGPPAPTRDTAPE